MYSRVVVIKRANISAITSLRVSSRLTPRVIVRERSYWHGASSRSLLSYTKYDVLRLTAKSKGDKSAVVSCHQGIEKNYTEFQNDVDTLASGLVSLNYPVGTMVGILAPNIYEWMVIQYATAKVGWVLVNINPAVQVPELEYVLGLSQCNALIIGEEHCAQNYHEMLQKLIPGLENMRPNEIKSTKLPRLKTLINIGETGKGGCMSYSDVLNSASTEYSKTADEINAKIDVDSPVNVQFTSGTTGRPKAVPLSHHNIVNNAYTLGYCSGVAQDENSAICLNVPLIHCFGCVIGSLKSVTHGAKMVLPAPRFNAKAALDAITKHKCTIVYGTPTMYVDMLTNLTSEYNVKSLHTGIMAGSPCPPALKKKAAEQLGIKTMHVAYGSTETSPVSVFTKPDSLSKRPDTVGLPLDHVEIKIVDKENNIVPFGQRGELCTRGYLVFKGYLHQPDKSAEVLKNGWYYSGDEGSMSEDGLITITGRVKDMIIRGGENIYPAEIENFLLSMPQIAEAYICGVPDERLGEEVCAWVRIAENQQLTEKEIKTFCKGQLSHFKIPRYIMFVDSFPKTLSGKIQKYLMREESCKRLGIKNQFV